MKSAAKVLVQICIVLLLGITPGYASQDKARALKVISEFSHAGGRIGTYHALLVGINDYKDPEIPDLETPVSDVNEMASLLEKKYGFQVSRLINSKASKDGIYNALRHLVGTAKKEDSVLIYYAGHGGHDKLVGGGYWVPWDARHSNTGSYFDNVLTQKLIAGMKARHVLLISDSCYSGTLFGKARALPPDITDKYYLSLFNEKSRWGMTSGNFTPVADGGTDGHSVFAYQLIKALRKNSSPYLSTQQLYTGFAHIVANNSEQSPMCRPIKNTGDQGGEFIFIMAGGPGPDPAAPAPPAGQKQAWLSVEANVANADVLVDGQSVGKTPLRDYELVPGDHRITVVSRGYDNYERNYTFRSSRSRDVNVVLVKALPVKGSLAVDTVPEDAVVKIMNIREKYQRGIELAPGKYHVQVLAPGYDTRDLWAEVGRGEDKIITVHLEKAEEKQPVPQKPTASSGSTAPAQKPETSSGSAAPSSGSFSSQLDDLAARKAKWEAWQSHMEADYNKLKALENDNTIPVKQRKQFFKAFLSTYGADNVYSSRDEALRKAATSAMELMDILGKPFVEPVTGMEFVWVPGGCYQMGDTFGDGEDNEKPVHEVCIDGFWMGKYEVTQAQYRTVTGQNPSEFKGDRNPVEQVSWDDAKSFISKLNRQTGKTFALPTEAQWEYAARSGGKKEKYAGGGNVDQVAWYKGNSGGKTHQVGTKIPNGLGIYDMSGNVYEWCEDVYDQGGYNKHSKNNPLITSGSSYRVIRGGSWGNYPRNVRAAGRSRYSADFRLSFMGFRGSYVGFRLCLVPESGRKQ